MPKPRIEKPKPRQAGKGLVKATALVMGATLVFTGLHKLNQYWVKKAQERERAVATALAEEERQRRLVEELNRQAAEAEESARRAEVEERSRKARELARKFMLEAAERRRRARLAETERRAAETRAREARVSQEALAIIDRVTERVSRDVGRHIGIGERTVLERTLEVLDRKLKYVREPEEYRAALESAKAQIRERLDLLDK